MGILSGQRHWFAIAPRALEADGGTLGEVTMKVSADFKIKQEVRLNSATQPTKILEVKKIVDRKTLILGPKCSDLSKTEDLSAYLVADGATLEAPQQNRPDFPIDKNQIDRFEHEEEPIMAKRVTMVAKDGSLVDMGGGSILAGIEWDDVLVTYPDGKTEVFDFYEEGVQVVTVTLIYRTSDKENLVRAFKETP